MKYQEERQIPVATEQTKNTKKKREVETLIERRKGEVRPQNIQLHQEGKARLKISGFLLCNDLLIFAKNSSWVF